MRNKFILLNMFFLFLIVNLYGKPLTIYHHAIKGDLNAIKKMVAQGTDVNSQNKSGATALMFAAGKGHEKLVVFLLEKGAKPNLIDKNHRTALMFATAFKHLRIVKIYFNLKNHLL